MFIFLLMKSPCVKKSQKKSEPKCHNRGYVTPRDRLPLPAGLVSAPSEGTTSVEVPPLLQHIKGLAKISSSTLFSSQPTAGNVVSRLTQATLASPFLSCEARCFISTSFSRILHPFFPLSSYAPPLILHSPPLSSPSCSSPHPSPSPLRHPPRYIPVFFLVHPPPLTLLFHSTLSSNS